MIEVKIKVVEGGKIVIPAEYRQALGVAVGDEVILRLEDGEIRVFTPRLAVKRAQQRLVRGSIPHRPSLADELIAEPEQKSKLQHPQTDRKKERSGQPPSEVSVSRKTENVK